MSAARPFVAFCLRIIAIAVTNVVFAWTMLGCAPGAIHVVPTDSTAFQQMLEADVAADARRAAMWMEPRARRRLSRQPTVLNDDKLPEAYTPNGEKGRWASQFHLSYAALRLMRAHFAATRSGYRQLESEDLVDVVDEAGGNTHSVNKFERDRQLDIADVEGRFVFEVVPPGPTHEAAGKKKVEWELLLLNKAMLGVPTFELGTNYEGEVGVRFAEGAPAWSLTWQTVDSGVISYQWRVLSVDDASEEAHRKAYLDNRWHDPTPYEMVRFGKALHEVVEKLVQAREALGRTRAATEMPILPGKTVVDYLRSVRLWSAQDEDIARLLPVMRRPPPPPPAQARRDARFIGQTLGGGGGGDPPGGYTVKGRPGNQPWHLHMGNAAHNVIGTQYKMQHPDRKVFINTVSILAIVREAGGSETLVGPDEALKRPDITDFEKRVVFEIKSSAEGQFEEAKAKVAKDIAAINHAMPPGDQFKHGTGFSGDFWVRFELGMPYWRLNWSTTAPGVIQYKWSKLNNNQVDEAKITNGIQEGWYTWVDLTEADVQQYAEKCEKFSQMYAVGATRLHTIQMVTDVVVGIIGDAAIVYLSPGLAVGKTVPKVARPSTRVPADPQINARSLGNDGAATATGSVHPAPRPTAPAKTPSGSANDSAN